MNMATILLALVIVAMNTQTIDHPYRLSDLSSVGLGSLSVDPRSHESIFLVQLLGDNGFDCNDNGLCQTAFRLSRV